MLTKLQFYFLYNVIESQEILLLCEKSDYIALYYSLLDNLVFQETGESHILDSKYNVYRENYSNEFNFESLDVKRINKEYKHLVLYFNETRTKLYLMIQNCEIKFSDLSMFIKIEKIIEELLITLKELGRGNFNLQKHKLIELEKNEKHPSISVEIFFKDIEQGTKREYIMYLSRYYFGGYRMNFVINDRNIIDFDNFLERIKQYVMNKEYDDILLETEIILKEYRMIKNVIIFQSGEKRWEFFLKFMSVLRSFVHFEKSKRIVFKEKEKINKIFDFSLIHPVLEDRVHEAAKREKNQLLTTNDILSIKTIDLNEYNVDDLYGLNYLTNLKYVSCFFSRINRVNEETDTSCIFDVIN